MAAAGGDGKNRAAAAGFAVAARRAASHAAADFLWAGCRLRRRGVSAPHAQWSVTISPFRLGSDRTMCRPSCTSHSLAITAPSVPRNCSNTGTPKARHSKSRWRGAKGESSKEVRTTIAVFRVGRSNSPSCFRLASANARPRGRTSTSGPHTRSHGRSSTAHSHMSGPGRKPVSSKAIRAGVGRGKQKV
jgi:hypothetical protein